MKWLRKGVIQAAIITGLFTLLSALLSRDSRLLVYSSDPGTRASAPAVDVVPEPPPRLGQDASVPAKRPVQEQPVSGDRQIDAAQVGAERDLHLQELPSVYPDNLYQVVPGRPLHISALSTSVSVDFRETLGSRYIEVLVLSPSSPPLSFPARRPGASVTLTVNNVSYDLALVDIDWVNSRISIRMSARRTLL